MVTPYDWQESIGHRAEYVETRLAKGAPVVAMSGPQGILLVTARRRGRKIFEIYDRLVYSGLGLQSDLESMRVAAIDFCHREGFNRSEDDVTIQRVVAALSQPVKNAFANFNSTPIVLRSLFAEVGESPEDDEFFALDYDGDYETLGSMAVVAGSAKLGERVIEKIGDAKFEDLEETLRLAKDAVVAGTEIEGEQLPEGLEFEAGLMLRDADRKRRFKSLDV